MKEKCNHKWKYIGFYNSGYYNHKVCIHCDKMELEKSTITYVKSESFKKSEKVAVSS
jgi:hypothetical protein